MAKYGSPAIIVLCLGLILLLAGDSDGLHVIGGMAVGTAVGIVLVLLYGYWRQRATRR